MFFITMYLIFYQLSELCSMIAQLPVKPYEFYLNVTSEVCPKLNSSLKHIGFSKNTVD